VGPDTLDADAPGAFYQQPSLTEVTTIPPTPSTIKRPIPVSGQGWRRGGGSVMTHHRHHRPAQAT